MKQISNRQKLVVKPRENVQKFLLKARNMRKSAVRRLEVGRKLKKSEKGRN